MSSKRNLKKAVGYVVNMASGICLIGLAKASAEEREEYAGIFDKISNLHADLLKRVNHPEKDEKGEVRLFYKKLNEDFGKEINNIFTRLNELAK